MKFSAFFIISFLSVISCGSVLSDDKSESYELGTISDTNSEIKKNNFSKTEIPDDSLDFALFNMMLASGKYSEAEIIKNAEILIKKGANPNISIEYN
ncbi:MAG: hypothetical protein GXO80_06885 [Chlorobi bacterium]|nr:hypothetical protein [Chlorobiota bacterium]